MIGKRAEGRRRARGGKAKEQGGWVAIHRWYGGERGTADWKEDEGVQAETNRTDENICCARE